MDYKTEYELRKEVMERFKDIHKDKQHVSDMVGIWGNDIRKVIIRLSQISSEKNTFHNELWYAKDMLIKHGSHRDECVIQEGGESCTCGFIQDVLHLRDALKTSDAKLDD